MKSIIGRKVGMTQVFSTDGVLIPVTVIEVLPNVVLQKKTVATDGYDALQVGIEEKRESLVNEPLKGHFKKAGATPKQFIQEIQGDELAKFKVGDSIKADLFAAGEIVDVQGITKGKGFSGAVKRWGYTIGPKAHGSGYHRGIGSMATSGRTNNRVHPGKRMSGHHGNYTRTILNLDVVAVDTSKNALLIHGAIPGPKQGVVTIRTAVKAQRNVKPAVTLVDLTAAK